MASAEKSLRVMIEHWLAPEGADDVRIARYKNSRPRLERYVCVETFNATRYAAMFFFRHHDGTWRIFPPNRERPAMRAEYISAPPCAMLWAPTDRWPPVALPGTSAKPM
ncbi:hypothetical protein B0G82_7401 [Paraburkholderia sp. BL17N1]|nr:hypothetical protein B0G82_7401 [Paraburkholderia sp. BL17N1]